MKTLILNIYLIIPLLAWGQTFEEVVDFNIDLSSLSNPDVVRDVANDGRVIILEGLLRDITVEETEAGASLWITLIGGEWIGTSEVLAYSCRIKFSGGEWLEIFSETESDSENSRRITPGDRMLVAAKAVGLNPENQIAELEMVDYRVFK